MKAANTQRVLDKFGKYLVQQARTNLTKQKKNVSKTLYESISYEARASDVSLEFDFLMEAYGEWVDKGRRAGKRPPFSPLRKWVQDRKIQFRDNSGKFLSYNETAGLIVGSIGKKGIPASNFYSRPFKLGYAKLPAEVVEAYALDAMEFLEYSMDKLNEEYKDGSN